MTPSGSAKKYVGGGFGFVENESFVSGLPVGDCGWLSRNAYRIYFPVVRLKGTD
jgi:hypothetical protein